MKRLFDVIFSIAALIFVGPVILIAAVLVWKQDYHWPLYTPWRVGKSERRFRLYKLRSMIIDADRSKVDTTTDSDDRITKVGHTIRRFKLDELPQFMNVLLGHMSLVGPRPNIDREVNLYSQEERRMLSVHPGITDLSSIVFSDLGTILADAEDANLAYNQLVRPRKSRLALFYVDNRTLLMDLRILALTVVAIISSRRARLGVLKILQQHNAPAGLITAVRRDGPLTPAIPPGLDAVVTSREL